MLPEFRQVGIYFHYFYPEHNEAYTLDLQIQNLVTSRKFSSTFIFLFCYIYSDLSLRNTLFSSLCPQYLSSLPSSLHFPVIIFSLFWTISNTQYRIPLSTGLALLFTTAIADFYPAIAFSGFLFIFSSS